MGFRFQFEMTINKSTVRHVDKYYQLLTEGIWYLESLWWKLVSLGTAKKCERSIRLIASLSVYALLDWFNHPFFFLCCVIYHLEPFYLHSNLFISVFFRNNVMILDPWSYARAMEWLFEFSHSILMIEKISMSFHGWNYILNLVSR